MSVDNIENRRASYINALTGSDNLVVAGGVWDITSTCDYLELFAALKDPADFKNQDYKKICNRLNTEIIRLAAACEGITGFSYCSFNEKTGLSIGILGVGQYGKTLSLSLKQRELLTDLCVYTYNPNQENQPDFNLTSILFYPHPLIAELQAALYHKGRQREDENALKGPLLPDWWSRMEKARRGYRTPNQFINMETLKNAADNPQSLLDAFGILDDAHRARLRFNPLKKY